MSRDVLLNFNESPFGLLPEAASAARLAVGQSGRYQFVLAEQLREEIAAWHGVPLAWVSLYPGSNRVLHYATMAFTSATAPLVVASPGYAVCETAARLAARPVRKIPLRADGSHDVEAMCAAAPAGGLIYVANPNNPTGSITPHRDLMDLLRKKNPVTTLLIDEAYLEFCDQPSLLDQVASDASLIVTRTFSKIHGMAGLRVGYAIAQPASLSLIHTVPPHDISVPGAAAALASLKQSEALAERKATIRRVREAFMAWLDQRGIAYTASQANCMMLQIGRDGNQLARDLAQRHNIHIGRSWPEAPDWVRVTIGLDEEMEALQSALESTLFADAVGA
ncbi:aminotransferase class I/II-fold pyridoxal phosphate-dependent enzyme [Rugamonas rivuli]|uniref:Aminotransferase class I/II-fold pyridoxal phosphate-dependent enzyme n=1 Tax=Rugamonas rivuli TaxID=2743358 RepID=A0A843S5X7_9BURK|nr:aminotransferase class I/II-fold pyridoxal phosphate-dependent enzyme [Rugamonas rivuli]MQA18062.1 aminotransferase class I/II-fold pyridoxal phosphate-dependent enzyme [Rugamonas rivuli]